nr:hypothetical protein KPHV_17250 [Kitasatospora purpeofusca]
MLGFALVAPVQATASAEPGHRAFDDPAVAARTLGGLDSTAGDARDASEDPAAVTRREALGRSRGGLTTKVHLAVDGRGLPLSIVLSAGNTADCTMFPAVLDAIRIPRTGAGRPRTKPDRVVADKAYSSRKIRHLLRRRGIRATIPERRDRIANRARRAGGGGRPPAFDKVAYRGRNVVERCFARLKQFRAVGEVDSGRPAGVSTSGFPRAASRTRRARLRAPGSPQVAFGVVQMLIPQWATGSG